LFDAPDFGRATGPAITRRIVDYTGTHRVQFHIATAGLQIRIGLHGAGFVPSLPQRSASSFQGIDIPGLPAGQSLHELAEMFRIVTGVDHQMNMVRHQAIGVHLAPELNFPFLVRIEIIEVIVIPGKDGLAVMAPLDYVVRAIRENETGLSGHDQRLPQRISGVKVE